jgi:hypothetical protein
MVVDSSLDTALETPAVVTVFCAATSVDDIAFIVLIDDGVERIAAFDDSIPVVEECVGFKDVDVLSDVEKGGIENGVVGSCGAVLLAVFRGDWAIVVVVFDVLFGDDITNAFVNTG